jgi:hypothetical protein
VAINEQEGAGGFLGRIWRWLRRERPARDLLVVRKGLSPAYYFFCKMFAQERGLVMVLDRRRESRRRRQRPTASIDRRAEDRRKPESTLDKDDFVVVKAAGPATAKPKGRI